MADSSSDRKHCCQIRLAVFATTITTLKPSIIQLKKQKKTKNNNIQTKPFKEKQTKRNEEREPWTQMCIYGELTDVF